MTTNTWNHLLCDQVQWHWTHQLQPRLAGLTDEEYFWEPTPGSWNVRRRGTGTAPVQAGAGGMTIDFAFPPPDPAPMTTIAWRLGHVVVGVLAMRNASHFGRDSVDYESFEYATTAQGALAQLKTEYGAWMTGIESLSAEDLSRPCGEHGFEDHPMAALILHIHKEFIHHLAEVSLLRDLYLHSGGKLNHGL